MDIARAVHTISDCRILVYCCTAMDGGFGPQILQELANPALDLVPGIAMVHFDTRLVRNTGHPFDPFRCARWFDDPLPCVGCWRHRHQAALRIRVLGCRHLAGIELDGTCHTARWFLQRSGNEWH